jgi:hypothetical protein
MFLNLQENWKYSFFSEFLKVIYYFNKINPEHEEKNQNEELKRDHLILNIEIALTIKVGFIHKHTHAIHVNSKLKNFKKVKDIV